MILILGAEIDRYLNFLKAARIVEPLLEQIKTKKKELNWIYLLIWNMQLWLLVDVMAEKKIN